MHWIDFLITVTLNPNKSEIQKITESQYTTLLNRIEIEKTNLQTLINNGVFSLNNEEEVTQFIRKYHSSLIILLDQLIEKKKVLPSIDYVDRLHRKLVVCIDELLSFIETRFFKYISLDDRVPITYFAITKHELKEKVKNIKHLSHNNIVGQMIMERLKHFFKSKSYPYELTFRVVLYKKQLVIEVLNKIKEICDMQVSMIPTYKPVKLPAEQEHRGYTFELVRTQPIGRNFVLTKYLEERNITKFLN